MKKKIVLMTAFIILILFQIKTAEAYEQHHITLPEGEGFKIYTKGLDYIKGQQIPFSCEIKDGYELVNLKIMTESGVELEHKSYNFEMPDEEVYIVVEVKKIDYKINKKTDEGVKLEVKETATIKEEVKFSFTIKEGYKLLSFLVFTEDGEEVEVNNNTFSMPSKSVIIEIITKKQEYKIHKKIPEGTEINVKEMAKKGEIIRVDYKLKEEEELVLLKATTKSGKEISITNNQFKMPEEDITIEIIAKTKEYNIGYKKIEGLTIKGKEKGTYKETIQIKYELEDGYQLEKLKVTSESGKEIKVNSNSFEMPNENVKIEGIVVKKIEEGKKFPIYIKKDPGIKVEIKENAKEQEEVSFDYQLEKGYVLKNIRVETLGAEIPYKNNKFTMPNNEVTLIFETEKEESKQEEPKKKEERNEQSTEYEVPKTSKESTLFLNIILFLGLLFLKRKME